jgi:hypothetical protein
MVWIIDMSDFQTRVERAADLRERPEDGGRILVYNPRSDNLHILGPIEAKIFALCDGRSISELIAVAKPDVIGGSDIHTDNVAAEVINLLNEFKERELVHFR